MEGSNRVPADKDTIIYSILLLIQKELVNLWKEKVREKEERETDKKEMSAIIGEFAKTLRKDVACEIQI